MRTNETMSRRALHCALLLAALALAGCATRAPAPASATPPAVAQTESPEVRPPDAMQVPDALPALEPIRSGGPNKPYAVLGETYKPLAPDAALSERGLASWYGRKFHGRRTASGELYNMYAMTAAHRTLPLPSYARVSNPANGRSVIVRVNDRGPFVKGRIVDLSYSAAQKLGVQGLATVHLVRITPDEIRNGAWTGASPVACRLARAGRPCHEIALKSMCDIQPSPNLLLNSTETARIQPSLLPQHGTCLLPRHAPHRGVRPATIFNSQSKIKNDNPQG